MTSWNDVVAAAPELGAAAASRFAAHLHHVLATLRADGSPRVSGTEVRVFEGEMYLGSMPNSRKGADLHRDPRLAVHAAPIDVELTDGDAKVSGRARLAPSDEAERFLRSLGNPDVLDGEVFAIDVEEVVLTQVRGEELVVTSWRPDTGVREIRRR